MSTQGVLQQFGIAGCGGNGTGSSNGEDGGFSRGAELPRRAYTTGMIIALAGILMFFMALASAYVVRKGSPSEDWRNLCLPQILWLNTAILFASSFTVARSKHRYLQGHDQGFRHWWNVTIALGLLFVAGQLIAWRQLVSAGLYLSTNPASSFFYVLTAAHAIHLLGGIVGLLFVRARIAKLTAMPVAIDVASLYWHFMDGLWLALFVFLLKN